MNSKLIVNCPHCKEEFPYYSSSVRPFCSDRCKLIDIGQWLDESYTVKGNDNSVYIENPDMLQRLMDGNNENF